MPLLKMAKDSKVPPPVPPEHEKPRAEARPGTAGTSGTELLLVTNTRRASDRFKAAQRAERTYRAKKRSAVCRANFTDAKSHYRDGFGHLLSAFKLSFTVLRYSPYLFFEKSEERQLRSDEKKRARAAERKKHLEKALARESAAADDLPVTSAADEEDDDASDHVAAAKGKRK